MFKIMPNSLRALHQPKNAQKITEPLRIKKPITMPDGRVLFIKNGVSYEKSVLPDGRIKLINLDTGDEVIGTSLAY